MWFVLRRELVSEVCRTFLHLSGSGSDGTGRVWAKLDVCREGDGPCMMHMCFMSTARVVQLGRS